MIPKSLIGKLIAFTWLVACLGVLLFAYIQRDIHDMPIAVIWLLLFLTFPIGIFAGPLAVLLNPLINSTLGLNYDPFGEMLVHWVIFVLVGYLQWFILIPKLFNYVLNKQNTK